MAVKLGIAAGQKSKPSPLKVKSIPVADLKEYSNNPRKNDQAVPAMVDLIKKFGFRQPILVRGVHVVDGHLRLKAARALEMKEIPTLDVGEMSDEDVRALRISMNKSAEFADWDTTALAAEFSDLSAIGFDLAFTGFETGIIDKIMADALGDKTGKKVKKTATADAGTEADPNYVSVTFHMPEAKRNALLKRLDKVMTENGISNRSFALLHLIGE